MRWKYLLCLFAGLLLSVSCKPFRSNIPDVPVFLERNLNIINCLYPGNYWCITAPEKAADRIGYGGVMLVCAFDNAYYAFDMACPVEASANIRVQAPDDALLAKCPRCGEIYDLSFGLGTPTLGISKEALLRYRTYLSVNNNISIKK